MVPMVCAIAAFIAFLHLGATKESSRKPPNSLSLHLSILSFLKSSNTRDFFVPVVLSVFSRKCAIARLAPSKQTIFRTRVFPFSEELAKPR